MITLSKENKEPLLSQNKLAVHLCMSVSEVNAGLNRLIQSKLLGEKDLLQKDPRKPKTFLPIKSACEECLIYGVKYFFPARFESYTIGIPTSYAAPAFKDKLVMGDEPIPVWPFAEGTQRGIALFPLYSSVPRSLNQYPDQAFYDFLTLLDAIRSGRMRESKLGAKILREMMYAVE